MQVISFHEISVFAKRFSMKSPNMFGPFLENFQSQNNLSMKYLSMNGHVTGAYFGTLCIKIVYIIPYNNINSYHYICILY